MYPIFLPSANGYQGPVADPTTNNSQGNQNGNGNDNNHNNGNVNQNGNDLNNGAPSSTDPSDQDAENYVGGMIFAPNGGSTSTSTSSIVDTGSQEMNNGGNLHE
jgi:hypothetical protein